MNILKELMEFSKAVMVSDIECPPLLKSGLNTFPTKLSNFPLARIDAHLFHIILIAS